jgi:microcystin-dependent protein
MTTVKSRKTFGIFDVSNTTLDDSVLFRNNISINETFDLEGTINMNFDNVKAYLPTINNIYTNNTSLLTNIINSSFPKYCIIMWSNPSTIPSGWVICNGSTYTKNNITVTTPDLRGRFVVCSGTNFPRSSPVGGSTTITLSVNNLPSHNHGNTTTEIESHNHTHSINVQKRNDGNNAWANARRNRGTQEEGTTHNAGNHTHPTTSPTDSTGDSTPFNIIPPYYALIYIMYI